MQRVEGETSSGSATHVRRTHGARPGGRSERVVRAIVDATVEELARVGYGRLRVEDVAARAGVNKTTVYRRWPTKPELVGAALRAVAHVGEPPPDTGSVREDLLALVARALDFYGKAEGRAVARLLTTEGADPEVDSLARSLREEVVRCRVVVVEQGKRRGELPASADARLVVDAVFATIATRVLRFREEIDRATTTRLVDMVLAGAGHRPSAQSAQGNGSSKWTHQLDRA